MRKKLILWACKQPVSASAKLLLILLASQADKRGRCYASQSQLLRASGLPRRTLQRALKQLQAAGLIQPADDHYQLALPPRGRRQNDAKGRRQNDALPPAPPSINSNLTSNLSLEREARPKRREKVEGVRGRREREVCMPATTARPPATRPLEARPSTAQPSTAQPSTARPSTGQLTEAVRLYWHFFGPFPANPRLLAEVRDKGIWGQVLQEWKESGQSPNIEGLLERYRSQEARCAKLEHWTEYWTAFSIWEKRGKPTGKFPPTWWPCKIDPASGRLVFAIPSQAVDQQELAKRKEGLVKGKGWQALAA